MEPSLTPYELRMARLENVERLANALGVPLPRGTTNQVVYRQRLVGAVMRHLHREAHMDAAAKLERR